MYKILPLIIFCHSFAFLVGAQNIPAVLVKDIAPGNADGLSSSYQPKVWNGKLIFSATDGLHGEELWISDGTDNGTNLLKDINEGTPNSNPGGFYAFGDYLYFFATDGAHGKELWRTDGTPAGTVLVKDLIPGTDSGNPGNFCAVGSYLYFSGSDYLEGSEIWRTDGTEAGTTLALNINPNSNSFPTSLTPFQGDKFFFGANDQYGQRNLYLSDGTTAGTMVLGTNIMPAFGNEMYVVDDKLYFVGEEGINNSEPWVSDGTAAGTFLLKEINPSGGSVPRFFQAFHNKVYFNAEGKFYVTDGTAAGTVLFRDMNLSPTSGSPQAMAVLGNYLYLGAKDAATNYGYELWRTDGTEVGTTLVKDIDGGFWNSYPQELMVVGDKIYFAASYEGYAELWVSDGTTTGTKMYSDINPMPNAGSSPTKLRLLNGAILCRAYTSDNGYELRSIAVPFVGTNDPENPLSWTAYPNPARDLLTLEIPGQVGSITVEVTNMLGQVVLRSQGSGESMQLQISALHAGMYQAIIHAAGQRVVAKTFVIER